MSAADVAPAGTGNEERGEHELVLGGKTYVLRPSFEAIAAAEKKAGYALTVLARMANTGELSLRQVGVIAAELIRAGSDSDFVRNVDDERIAQLAYEAGMRTIMPRLALVLIDAALGGRKASGEAKAVAES
ncbi:hypothetical protein S2M10_31660 [Sphingomonas sp. S2M10]|uniref:GTA-gp10 family protein n=1 Tax=Sphingomonas sp. S2M10 TaxID=2705010 RepID=UPI001456F1C6|nr:hypothetical protein [Sphingomonas sp. S2M10]